MLKSSVVMLELNAFSIPFQARVRDKELREREAWAQAGNASSRSTARNSALEQREAALAEREAAMARASAAAEYARSEAEALWRNHKASPPYISVTVKADPHAAVI